MALTPEQLVAQRKKAETIALNRDVMMRYEYDEGRSYDKEGAAAAQMKREIAAIKANAPKSASELMDLRDAPPTKEESSIGAEKIGNVGIQKELGGISGGVGQQARYKRLLRGQRERQAEFKARRVAGSEPMWAEKVRGGFMDAATSLAGWDYGNKVSEARRRTWENDPASRIVTKDEQVPAPEKNKGIDREGSVMTPPTPAELAAQAEEERLAQRDNYKRIGGGLVNTGEGKFGFMTGTTEDGRPWSPGNETMAMMNRTTGQKKADEQARLNRVNQNLEMQANAQNIATGLDRSTQESQLYRANRLAREKPTAANIARHRTLSTDMEKARQTRSVAANAKEDRGIDRGNMQANQLVARAAWHEALNPSSRGGAGSGGTKKVSPQTQDLINRFIAAKEGTGKYKDPEAGALASAQLSSRYGSFAQYAEPTIAGIMQAETAYGAISEALSTNANPFWSGWFDSAKSKGGNTLSGAERVYEMYEIQKALNNPDQKTLKLAGRNDVIDMKQLREDAGSRALTLLRNATDLGIAYKALTEKQRRDQALNRQVGG